MTNIPKDLEKVNKKAKELIDEKGVDFASGFQLYMLFIDYEKRDSGEVLRRHLRMINNPEVSDEYIDTLAKGEIDNDLVNGFNYGKEYSQQVKYTYKD